MISSIDYLDSDVSNLLGKYIENKKKYNDVINELKDNIHFTTHINYYDKYFATHTNYPSIDVVNFGFLRNMRENKKETINMINKIIDKTGWVQHDPRRPSYHTKVYEWEVKQIDGPYFDKKKKEDVDKHHNNLLVVDKKSGCIFRSYPPHSRHYNIKDLLKNIK
jgi:hypothetical protein